uniref:Uncharacterized protein n=1 Tax=Buteo japonicus TaxID=224669 RepID=A0A8C0BT67_9AVES
MKVPAATLAALLLMAICSPAEAHLSDSSVAASSKMTGLPSLLGRNWITSAYKTSSMCSQPGVIRWRRERQQLFSVPELCNRAFEMLGSF